MSTTPKTVAIISTETVLEQLKALDAQRAELLEGAKREALDKAERAVADLNSLGFAYRLIEGKETPVRLPRKVGSTDHPRSSRGQVTSKRQISDEPCKICHFKTDPSHDARAHRGQKEKQPFTVEELMEKHLSKVG